MRVDVVRTGDKDRFVWVRVQFTDEDMVPSAKCEVNIALRKEDIQDLNAEGIHEQAVTEATLFLERVLSSRFT